MIYRYPLSFSTVKLLNPTVLNRISFNRSKCYYHLRQRCYLKLFWDEMMIINLIFKLFFSADVIWEPTHLHSLERITISGILIFVFEIILERITKWYFDIYFLNYLIPGRIIKWYLDICFAHYLLLERITRWYFNTSICFTKNSFIMYQWRVVLSDNSHQASNVLTIFVT